MLNTRNLLDTMQFLPQVPDTEGMWGDYGGAFIPEILHQNIQELQSCYREFLCSTSFRDEFAPVLDSFVGRPTPLFYAENLSKKYHKKIWIKREDLSHTGAHKINNALAQALLAQKLGKTNIVAETGAGQHGVASATACAKLGLKCTVFMGKKDIARQKLNVDRMKMLGAEVVPVTSGSSTLKDATNEAMKYWIANPFDTHYIIGSAVGPHPYPDMVAFSQSIIGLEALQQFQELAGKEYPDAVLACMGGGSNALGMFYPFIDSPSQIIGAEAGGEGIDTDKTAATLALGKLGFFHGSKSYLIQDADGQIIEPHSISAGLDYPGISPIISYLQDKQLLESYPITDQQALDAALELSQLEGLIPALESAHSFACFDKIGDEYKELIICLSGRGDKDMTTYSQALFPEGN